MRVAAALLRHAVRAGCVPVGEPPRLLPCLLPAVPMLHKGPSGRRLALSASLLVPQGPVLCVCVGALRVCTSLVRGWALRAVFQESAAFPPISLVPLRRSRFSAPCNPFSLSFLAHRTPAHAPRRSGTPRCRQQCTRRRSAASHDSHSRGGRSEGLQQECLLQLHAVPLVLAHLVLAREAARLLADSDVALLAVAEV